VEDAAVLESGKAETPVVWALAGAAPHSGSGIAAFLLAGTAALTGRKAVLFRPGQWDAPAKSPLTPPSPLPEDEMAAFFAHLDAPGRAAAQFLYRRLSHLPEARREEPLWVLDLGCSRSHSHWDLFWSADLPLIVTGPREERELGRAADSALLRWLERALALDDESLHAYLKRRRTAQAAENSDDFLCSSRLQQLGTPGPVHCITVQKNSGSSALRKAALSSAVPELPLRLEEAGALICDCPTALLIRDLHTQVHPLPHPVHHWLLQRLEARFAPAPAALPVAHPGAEALLALGLYTQIGSKQILNIDLNFFNLPAVVSPFAATEEGL